MRLAIAVMLCLPLFGAIQDPGAGLETRAARRAARVAAWQVIYEGLTAGQIRNQARVAVYDIIDQTCLENLAKDRMGGTPSDAEAQEYIEDHLSALTSTETSSLLIDSCPSTKPWTPEPLDQGGEYDRVLIVRGAVASDSVRSKIPVLPRIGSVPPIVWSAMAHGTCTIGGATDDCYASHYPWPEADIHLLESIIRSEGLETAFALVPLESCETVGEETTCTTWQEAVAWTSAE